MLSFPFCPAPLVSRKRAWRSAEVGRQLERGTAHQSRLSLVSLYLVFIFPISGDYRGNNEFKSSPWSVGVKMPVTLAALVSICLSEEGFRNPQELLSSVLDQPDVSWMRAKSDQDHVLVDRQGATV